MRRRFRIACAATAVAAVSLAAAAPAGAQEAPTLGFEIDITEGAPGDEVNGVVDVADVAEHCPANLAEVQAEFAATAQAFLELQPEFEVPADAEFMTAEQMSWQVLAVLAAATAENAQGAAGLAHEQSFVMTFADIATQAPVGERANFDPAVGEATVTVPDVAPGSWAVAATCVGPATDVDTVRAAIGAGADTMTAAFNLPEQVPVTWQPEGTDLFTWLFAEGGPAMLEPLMVPRALGFQIFCVVDADGVCPAGAVPPSGPTAPALPPAPPAQPVIATPTFTG